MPKTYTDRVTHSTNSNSLLHFLVCDCSASVPSMITAVPRLLHPLSWLLLNVALIPCCFYTHKRGQECT
uniref:Uncharacterized protein n=2 Tax=Picea TaxID=3328 RepID=A0A101M1E2_PICGL|nr:hypothetical protein ABT39_MTgene3698 [Picea glauca]QHR90313.1 hypothetical protein Q903MT_gene4336 [Picea sitchensis]